MKKAPASPPTTITTALLLPVLVQVNRDAGTADYAPIKEMRIYRTPSGAEVGAYFFVGAIPVLGQDGPPVCSYRRRFC